ncbi:MAG: penicillin-binding protein 2 [Alphaproteobacteria bacterium]|nr:penicillin-binding protein 2 [Alphaproteobacteria bacterium]
MARSLNQLQMLNRRTVVFGGIQAAAGAALLSRLYYLQFVKGDELKTEAEGNRIKVQLIIPPRGVITDRMGVMMAGNDISYRLYIDRDQPKQARKTIVRLAELLAWDAAQTKRVLDQIPPRRPAGPLLLAEQLSWENMAKIEFHLPELPGVAIEEGQWRNYPFADHAAHLLGYVGKVSERDNRDHPLLRLPDMKIGKNGIEYLFEERLRGTAGTRHIEVNALGQPIRELKKEEPIAGGALKLTVDSRLQEFIVQRLGDQAGAVVVMHVHTGDILALVSMPAFDPNEFSKGIKEGYWKALNANEKIPLMNKAITGQYPPGSTFKMLVGLAALREGKINPRTTVHCPGHFFLGNHRFNCWKPEGHGTMDYKSAIAQSCDTYFYTVGRQAGIEGIAKMANDLGLGESTELGLMSEKGGIIPTPEWKARIGRGVWNPGETINTSIGQGDVLTTPLQLAVMIARMVNGGKKILPRLTEEVAIREDGFIDIDEAFLKLAQEGMDMVTNAPTGTAYASGIREEAYRFGGKTGTSQVRRITIRGLNQNTLPWKYRHHGLFVGYGPTHDPQYCCAVLIEHGGGGASAAAPVAKDVMQKTMELFT